MKLLLILALGLVLLAPITGVYKLYYLSYISFGVGLAIFWLVKKGAENLQVTRVVEQERIFAGEKTKIILTISNKSVWPIFWARYKEQVPIELHSPLTPQVVSLSSKQEHNFEYVLAGRQRGVYSLGPTKVTLGDGLGFQELKLNFSSPDEMIVYPRILPLADLGLPSRIAFGDLIWPQRIYRDPSSFRGLREYQLGDQLKDVYWPATASTGKLMVKEYESTVTVENMICLNLNQADYEVQKLKSQTELAIEVAASIAHYLVQVNQTVGVATNGYDPLGERRLEPGQGASHLMELMELLARLELTTQHDFLSVVEKQSHTVPLGSTLLLITKLDTTEIITKSLQLCRQGLNVVLIVVGREVLHPQYLNRSQTEKLIIYQLQRKEDIYAW